MRTFLRLITVLATFGLVSACAGTDGNEGMSASGGAFEMGPEMTAGQKRLTDALARGGAEKSPAHTAAAREQFDCWMKQTMANKAKEAAACKSGFYGAMALLEADVFAPPEPAAAPMPTVAPTRTAEPNAPPRTRHFLVFFDLDSAKISADEAKAVAAAADFAKENAGSNVYVTGHTDQSGSAEYNMKLAKMRADEVVKGLTGRGIGTGRIGELVLGENDPAVSRTGQKDQRNRRVVISVIY